MTNHTKKKSIIQIRQTSLIIQNALLVNEAIIHEKNGNYNKAIFLYNQVSDRMSTEKKLSKQIFLFLSSSFSLSFSFKLIY